MVPARDLWKILGYPSPGALRQARSRGTLPIKCFAIPNRRGLFARSADVEQWLAGVAPQKKSKT